MKKTLLAALLAVCATSALAEPSAILKVKGTLTNSACTPTLTQGGVIDYGSYTLSDLSSTAVNQLGQKNIDLNITCDVATKVSWHLVDDSANSRAGITVANGNASGGSVSDANQTYGVGFTDGNVAIGNYSLFVNVGNVVADTATVDTIYRLGSSGSWTKSTDGITEGQDNREITVAAASSVEPLAFTSATFPLVTSLAIQDTDTLAITDDTNLAGQVTISLSYP